MADAFRSAFFVSALVTLITLPAVFVGFFPITLIMGIISLACLVLWRTMHNARGKELQHGAPVQVHEPTAGTSSDEARDDD